MNVLSALRVFGKPEFREVLATELRANKSQLPTEKACYLGGWPRDEAVISVGNESELPDSVFADVTISFNEVANPSCGTHPIDIPRVLGCRIVIDRKTGEAVVNAIDDFDPPEEF